jgi:hypothetical protein
MRRLALALSAIAVALSVGFGFVARRAYAMRHGVPDEVLPTVLVALVLLLFALLFRMGGAICELLWLERTWSNLPERLRKVGPIDNVGSGLLIGVSIVPGVAWVWRLGLVVGIARGFEAVRAVMPFHAPVPRRLGMAAVVASWVPGLNVYVAPFLWEIFAARVDAVVREIMATRAPLVSGPPAVVSVGAPTG